MRHHWHLFASLDDEDLTASTPYTRKSASHNMGDPNRKSDFLSSTRIPEHSADQLFRKTDSYMKERPTEHVTESNRRTSHSESEYEVKLAAENHVPYESKYCKPTSYTKPPGSWCFSSFLWFSREENFKTADLGDYHDNPLAKIHT